MTPTTESQSCIAEQTPTAVVEYTTESGRRYRSCFYLQGETFERVEEVREDGQWRPLGTERITDLSLQLNESEPSIGTQAGVER